MAGKTKAAQDQIEQEAIAACEVCRFYSPDHKACRRFPQHITKHAHEWCGEFSR